MQSVDDTDRRLLRQLQADAARSITDLAEHLGLPASALTRRLERLERIGVIERYTAAIDWRALGYEIEVSLRVTLDKTQPNAFDGFIAAARGIPEVDEIQTFLGRVDVRLNVLARDMAHYQQIYRKHILTLPHIADIEALMLISNVKNSESLPL